MLHGGNDRLKLIIGTVLIAENILLCFMENFPIDWWQLVTVDMFAIFAGLAMDYAFNGFSPATLLPVIAIAAEFMLRYADVETATAGYITSALCGACLIGIAFTPKLRRGSAGTVITILGIAVNAMSILYLNGMLLPYGMLL